jgi:hypothetical protein
MQVVHTLVKIKMVLGLDVEIKICNSSPGSHDQRAREKMYTAKTDFHEMVFGQDREAPKA